MSSKGYIGVHHEHCRCALVHCDDVNSIMVMEVAMIMVNSIKHCDDVHCDERIGTVKALPADNQIACFSS